MPAWAVFLFVGPVAVASAAALYRWLLGPRIALVRLRLGIPTPVIVSVRRAVGGSPGAGSSGLPLEDGRLVRVEEQAHLTGGQVHYVVPVSELDAHDPAEPFVVTAEDGTELRVGVPDRWRRAFALAVDPDGPRLRAGSRRAGWVAAPVWTLSTLVLMAMLSGAAAAVVLTGSSGTGQVLFMDVEASLCDIADAQGQERLIECWVRPPQIEDPIAYNDLAWPFEGETYDRWTAWTFVAVPGALALAFAAGHVLVARSRRRSFEGAGRARADDPRERAADRDVESDGERDREHDRAADGKHNRERDREHDREHDRVDNRVDNGGSQLVYTYLPEVARILEWPDCPDDRTDPDPGDLRHTHVDDDDYWPFHALRRGDGGWSMLLVGPPHESAWLLTPDAQPPLKGVAWLPAERPEAGLMWITFGHSRAELKEMGRNGRGRRVSYRGLHQADACALATVREDLEGQLRDQAEETADRASQ